MGVRVIVLCCVLGQDTLLSQNLQMLHVELPDKMLETDHNVVSIPSREE